MRPRAFTLIELLVVIAIIALLVSILMPSLQKAKEMAKDILCSSNQKNITYGFFLYAQDYDDMIPYNRSWTDEIDGGDEISWRERIGRIPPEQVGYFIRVNLPSNPDVLGPINRICIKGYVDFTQGSRTEGNFKCPTGIDQMPRMRSPYYFSVNAGLSPTCAWHGGDMRDKDEDLSTQPTGGIVRFADIRKGGVLIADGGLRSGGPTTFYLATEFRTMCGQSDDGLFVHGPWPWRGYINAWSRTPPVDFYGHTGESTVLAFTDGHVEKKKNLIPQDFDVDVAGQ